MDDIIQELLDLLISQAIYSLKRRENYGRKSYLSYFVRKNGQNFVFSNEIHVDITWKLHSKWIKRNKLQQIINKN